MMKHYISMDGGGSGLAALIFDENLKLIRHTRSGPTNPFFTPEEEIIGHMTHCLDVCIGSLPVIEAMYHGNVGMKDALVAEAQKRATIKFQARIVEGRMAIMAGAGTDRGLVAQAGTGSNTFIIRPEELGGDVMYGGFGPYLGDEGSGHDIGIRGLQAAIHADIGRGPHTLILSLLREEWGFEAIWDMANAFYHHKSRRQKAASAARIVSKAAHAGDNIALEIYRHAAHEQAKTTLSAIKTHNCDDVTKNLIVISGSAWKGHPDFFEIYKQLINEEYPDTVFTRPVFEPVMGGVVKIALDQGRKAEEFMPLLMKEYSEFLYENIS